MILYPNTESQFDKRYCVTVMDMMRDIEMERLNLSETSKLSMG